MAKIIGVAITLVFLIIISTPTHERLTALPVPQTLSQTTLSGPLALEHINNSVLGAQAINAIDFVNEINKARQKAGSPALRLSRTLMDAAKLRANVILKYQNFSHQDPHEGIELGTVLPKLNYHFVYASENIGMGGISAPDFVNGFMHSTSHRENLLDPKFTETGAAVVDGPYKQYYVNIAVQLFAIPGGLDEYLGYNAHDRLIYEEALHTLDRKLFPIRRIAQQLFQNPDYEKNHLIKLDRQQYILQTVVSRMRKNVPFKNDDVTLILEYNTLL